MDLRLRGSTALITGASGGIGRALARVFADEGARLVLHAHARVDALSQWVEETGLEALVVGADLRDPIAVSAMFERVASEVGRIDHCVANAGAWPKPHEHLDTIDDARMQDTVAINLLGSAWTVRGWMRQLKTTADTAYAPSAVLIGSTAGHFGEAGHADYAMAKAGLVGLVRSVKNELPRLTPRARINLVQPGWTVTEMARDALADEAVVAKVVTTMPLRQLGRAEDVARQVAWLCSPMSRHLTGEIVTVAGGMEGRVLWSAEDLDVAAICREASARP